MIFCLITYCMVKDNCARMSQICVFCFTAMCACQTFIEAVALVGLLRGRSFGETTVETQGTKHVYTTTLERHAFFDAEMGAYYNFQSAVILAAPFLSLLGFLLGFLTYKAYPTSVFEDPEGVAPYE